MNTLDYIVKKFNIDLTQKSPFVLKFNRLTDLPQLFKELNFKSGAEIGVLYAKYSEILCKALPDTQIHSVDPWTFYPLHNNFRRSWRYQPMYERVVKTLAPYPNSHIVRKYSVDAANDFKDESLDFVFIDADHRFQFVTNDIAEWSKKVKVGGIVAGHDYQPGRRTRSFVHVIEVVDGWTKAYDIHPWFVLEAPKETSWMWVKLRSEPIK